MKVFITFKEIYKEFQYNENRDMVLEMGGHWESRQCLN